VASTFHDHLFNQYGDAHSSNHLELPLFAKSQQPTINLPNLEETVASAEMDGLRIQLIDQFVMDVSDVVVHVVHGALHCRRIVEATVVHGALHWRRIVDHLAAGELPIGS
jgi:hypothetical protein